MFKFLCLLLLPAFCYGQNSFPGVERLKAAAIPAEIKIRGKIEDAWKWTDKLGENILVTAVLGPYKDKSKVIDGETNNVELFAAHYVKTDSGYRVRWRMNDFVKDCELDLVCHFMREAFKVTDLDNNGIAETKLQYKMVCHGDVSPPYMKLIMHEDSIKYALRGEMWVIGASEDTVFRVTEKNVNLEKFPAKEDDYTWVMGRYETEKDFVRAPQQFLIFARKEWLKFAKETFE
ncbi:hypothetical protein LZZ85_10515 [Terrimonas sp. NA20]|uniref:Uncharacterized protein n=1 Tax=Terrimonas ginsenosidimutans TaxID=2908004 RepID=A0ABS9KQY6_9BACT|nr:hypothetical protein [Terrimonas ginsenosidimutans]MCG2614717.1 hypothetical protein [Terrimonas ginsenosidimutans]